ncbi:YkvA family protein [Terrabacter terrigena]|uniref:YkvA family protein n=1 Tax=Terrabacter terrigena TaxID=574718 RepID=A0ABW3N2T0_9MICO
MKTASRIKMAATVASVVRASTRPGAPGIAQRVQAVPRLVRAALEGTYAGTTFRRLGLVAAAVVYVASPVDLLPEAFLPVLGAADDAVVITWAIKAFLEETDRFIAWEAGQGLHRPRADRRAPGPVSETVAGEALPSTAQPAVRAWAGGVSDGRRRDRDTTGAAAPGRSDRGRLPEGARQAATDYVLESVRKRLER